MNNDIARMRCPVCGTQTGARINKNGIIYANCPMGHQAKLNKPDSHAAKVALDAGQSWNNGVVYIYPNKQETESAMGFFTRRFTFTLSCDKIPNVGSTDHPTGRRRV